VTVDIRDRITNILGQQSNNGAKAISVGRTAPPLESLVPGYWLRSAGHSLYVGETRVPLSERHGERMLREFVVGAQADWPALLYTRREPFDLAGALLIDTETTGLGRGPGTFAFMVGIGRVDVGADSFVVRQYLAPDYGDEPLLLERIEAEAANAAGLISFNGRSFDLPVLETRYILNGWERSPLSGMAHLDLLPTARRLWGRLLASCALSALESDLLKVARGDSDIPGYEIPAIYAEYLATGETENVARVYYHNRYDILSMVTLAAEAASALADPPAAAERGAYDPAALGRIREADESADLAAEAYRAGLTVNDASIRQDARRRLAAMLKRSGRVQEAVPLWLDGLADNALYSYVELAKYYEHTVKAYGDAEILVTRAMQGLATGMIAHPNPDMALQHLSRRLARLQRRRQRMNSAPSRPSANGEQGDR